MQKGLMQHEIEAAEIIAQQPRILLFDAMGVGKTVSVLDGLKRASEGFVGSYKCIVVAPNTLLGQWSNEISNWLSVSFNVVLAVGNKTQREVKYNYFNSIKNENVILLTNYSFLVKDSFFDTVKAQFLILDEGYLIRNKKTRAHQFLIKFIDRFNKVVILSGNAESFSNSQFYDIANLMFPGMVPKGDKSSIHQALGDKYISRSLGEILDINPPEIKMVPLTITNEQQVLLKDIAVQENRALKSGKYNAGTYYRKRLLALNAPGIITGQDCNSPKLYFLLKHLENQLGKSVVYCPDRKFFKTLKTFLNEKEMNFVSVSGEMPIYIRDRNLRLFTNDPKIKCLLLSGVGKYGLNLQVASNLIFMCVPKSNFELSQLIGRVNRINQNKKVVCLIPYYQDTEEENLIKKLDVFEYS